MQSYDAAGANAPVLVLAHGAGAGERHPWMTRVARGLAAAGVGVITFEFPYMEARRRRPDPAPVLEQAFEAAWHEACRRSLAGTPCFAGGKSMGGRIASQAAARGGLSPRPAGLLFFGYPLHPPGAPDKRRDRHLSAIDAPLLFLHGTRDPFGSADDMRALSGGLPDATLHLVDGGDHSLHRPRRDDPGAQALDEAVATAAAWIVARASRA
jgi:hypothetical protein